MRELDFSLLDRLPVPAAVHDRAGRFVFVNRAVRAMPELPEGFLRGESFLAYVPEPMRSQVARRISETLTLVRPTRLSVVLEDPRASTRRIAVALEIIPLCGDRGVEGFVAFGYRDGDPDLLLAESAVPVRLTRRQQEILALLVRGRSTKEIAATLYITPSAVRNHVHNVLVRLGVRTRAEAVESARRRGLTPPQPVRPADVPPLVRR